MLRVPPLFRPRLTWRYVLCSSVVAYVIYCFLFSLPLFASPLPQYTGPHPVGAIDIEVPVSKPRIVAKGQLKDGRDAFQLETVLFTIYYPATKARNSKSKHYWIPKPVGLTAQGYAKFAHIDNFATNLLFTSAISGLVGGITIPAKVDVPLAGSSSKSESRADYKLEEVIRDVGNGFPVIVFSHGMASSRTDYTAWAGELASRGYIVAMIEHRDGSSPGSPVMQKNKPSREVIHFDKADLANSADITTDDFKARQLAFREAEIEETVRVLQDINAGHGSTVYSSNARGEGVDLDGWKGKLDSSHFIMAGHSYGATGALQALKRAHPSGSLTSDANLDNSLPFTGAIILDPGKSSGPLNDDISVPVLIIHSNSWSKSTSVFYGRPHFSVVRDIVKSVNERGIPSWFATSLGTSHPSVTDAPLLEPLLLSWTTGSTIDVHEGLRQYVHVSEDFLWFLRTGERRGLVGETATYPDYEVDNSQTRERWRQYWQLHVAPKQVDLD